MDIYSQDSRERFYQANLRDIISDGRILSILIIFVALGSLLLDFLMLKSTIFVSIRLLTIFFAVMPLLLSFSRSVTSRRIINTGIILNAHFGINLMNIHVVILAYSDPVLPEIFKTTTIFVICITLIIEVVFASGIRRFLYLAVLPPALIMTTTLGFMDISDTDWMVFMIYPFSLFIILIIAFRQDKLDRAKYFANQLNMQKNITEHEAKLKDEFISNVRHELRTPLNGIVGIHQLLKKTCLSDEQKDLLEMAERSSKQLSNMIEELLDISTMDQRTITLKLEEIELLDFTESVFRNFETVGKKEIDYRFNFNADKELVVTCDQKRLYQVMCNLLGNAEKFTSDGIISLDIDCISENESSAELKISVTDTGIGIPQDKIGKVFDRFYQVDSSTSKKFKGTGLGLAITKRIIEAMGGKIMCNSIEGQGSVFFFVVRMKKGLRKN